MKIIREVGTNPYSKNFLTNGVDIQARAITIPADSELATTIGGRSIVLAGTIYPADDETAEGLIRHDYDITDGEVVGALITHASVLEEALHTPPSATAKTALIARGIMFTPKAEAIV